MKIIQAMKAIKALQVKVKDLQEKIKAHAALMDYENPTYPDQRAQVAEWMQSTLDSLKEIERLRLAIQTTNLQTPVTIDLGGRPVTKTIAGWIHRRRDLAGLALETVRCLNDRNLKDGFIQNAAGAQTAVKVQRFYDPTARDSAAEVYRSEPTTIDSSLEVVNAVTDLIEVAPVA
jgi:hypothetical protein